MQGTRHASHAGSWYEGSSQALNEQLNNWLAQAERSQPTAKALIGPHAGYRFSGPNAAWAYKHIDPEAYDRVFLLGPSHHVHIQGCALPASGVYETPIGNIPVDQGIVSELERTGKFQKLNSGAEEDEHSLEMHLPYIRKVFESREITLVPVMVGNVSGSLEEQYGMIFAPYFQDPRNLFVISSDFCHWGARFRFTPYDQSKGQIWESIQAMDQEGMQLIERHDLEGFKRYLGETLNTICGRNPIILLLNTIRAARPNLTSKFVKYDQSEHVTSQNGSSVSYASCVSFLNQKLIEIV